MNAITEEQVQELADKGISPVVVGDSRETDENILKGEYKLVFGSAEMWLRKTWINNFKKSALRNNVELIVVDEAHVAQSW